jgi:hypothetical protein
MSDTLDIVQGASKTFPRQRKDASRNAYNPVTNPSPYLSTDTLSCRIWAGDDTVVLASPAAVWTNVSTASFVYRLAASDTANLAPGRYCLQCGIARAGYDPGIIDGEREPVSFRVTIAPGTATAPLAFTVLDDLLKYLPMLEDIQAPSSQVGFREEQEKATNRLIDTIIRMYRPATPVGAGLPGYNAMLLFGGSSNPSQWLRQQLTPLAPNSAIPANMPMRLNSQPNFVQPRVSTSLLLYDFVLEIVSKWALCYVLRAQISRSSNQDWWDLTRQFTREADALFRSRDFEVDLATPQEGWGGFVINGGASSLR